MMKGDSRNHSIFNVAMCTDYMYSNKKIYPYHIIYWYYFAQYAIPASTKKTHGSATPLPHILYSAESVCGFFSHLTIWFRVRAFLAVPITRRCVSNTSIQKRISSSVGSGVSRLEHHQSGNPWSRAHSVGVSLRTA